MLQGLSTRTKVLIIIIYQVKEVKFWDNVFSSYPILFLEKAKSLLAPCNAVAQNKVNIIYYNKKRLTDLAPYCLISTPL